MQTLKFEDAVQKILFEDDRYQFEAYVFVQEAIGLTQKALGRDKPIKKHIGGKELLNGIRDHALDMFGPMTATVLSEWGIRSCEDFGEIVFNLIKHKQASQSESDSQNDFKGGYNFDDAFRKPFLPSKRWKPEPKSAPAKMISQD